MSPPIHFVIPQLEPYYGMERAVGTVLRTLAQAGESVSGTVISGSVPVELSDLPIESLSVSRSDTRLLRAVLPLRRSVLRTDPATALIGSGAWGSLPLGLALAGTRRSYTCWEHSALPERMRADRRLAMLFRATHLPTIRPESVVAVSGGVARTVRDRYPNVAVFTIPNILDSPLQHIPTSPRAIKNVNRTVMCTVGAFRTLKNYQLAVRVLSLLPDSYELHMAGDGPCRGQIENLIAQLGLQNRVHLLGHVPDVSALLDSSDVLLHPSLAETFGFTLLEAAEAGLPVVATAAATMDELVPELVPGILAKPTATAMAEAVQSVVGSGRPSRRIKESAAQLRREAFSAEQVGKKWKVFLLLNDRRGRGSG